MNTSKLQAILRNVNRRRLWIGSVTALCWVALASGALLLAGIWLDLVWDMPPEGRIGLLATVLLGGAASLGYLCWRQWRGMLDRVAARQLDQAGGFGGTILSGWELSIAAPENSTRKATHALTDTMAAVAIERASRQAGEVPLAAAISSRPLRRGALALAIFAAVTALLAIVLPALALTQWRRFLHPYADIPPYTPLEIAVEPGDFELLYGEGMSVQARVAGGSVEGLELVTVRDGEEKSLDMFPEAEASWRADLARVDSPLEYYVRSGKARSKHFNVRVITTPRIADVQFRVTPPAYARRSPYEGPLPKGGLAGLTGTRVQIRAKSNRPLSGGELIISSEQAADSTTPRPVATTIALRPVAAGDSEVAGEFTIQHDGTFELKLTDIEGQTSQETFAGAIVLLHDDRPFVRLLDPRPESLATPEAQLPVSIAAEDDFGVSRVALFRSLNHSRPLPKEEALPPPHLLRIHEQTFLPLSQYGLLPGDEIRLFARVEDNDPHGAKGSESNVVTVRIISQEDFERMVRTRQGLEVLLSKYQQARRRLESLAEEMAELQEALEQQDGPLSDAQREQLAELAKNMKQAADAIKESAKHLLPYDLDENLTAELTKLAEALAKSAEAVERMQADPQAAGKPTAAQLAELAKQLGKQQEQFNEQAMNPLERFAAIFPLMEDQARFVILVQRQRDLAERLAALKNLDDTDDPRVKARMRELEEEQRGLAETLRTLLDDIEEHALVLPEEPELDELRSSALEFVEAVRGSAAEAEMSAAELALTEFSGRRGHAHAVKAAEILESFLSQCKGLGGQCEGAMKFSPSLSQCMGNSAQQLLAEAGLGMGSGGGPGGGAGSGPGYSARRGGGNMGLYGGMPALAGGGTEGGGTGNGDLAGNTGGGFNNRAEQANENMTTSEAAAAAGGLGSGQIPLRYRQRVGWYFRRIAEETSGN